MFSVIKSFKRSVTLGAVAIGIGFGGAVAAPVDTNPITSDYYIEHNDLLWAWASPVSTENFGGNTLYLPGVQDGWRFATDEEWAARPHYSAFNRVCASRFWNSRFTHCDFADGFAGSVTNTWNGGGNTAWDLWYVSGDSGPGGDDVPAPAGLALLGLGLLGLGLARRK